MQASNHIHTAYRISICQIKQFLFQLYPVLEAFTCPLATNVHFYLLKYWRLKYGVYS
jgi:hypothetical protein